MKAFNPSYIFPQSTIFVRALFFCLVLHTPTSCAVNLSPHSTAPDHTPTNTRPYDPSLFASDIQQRWNVFHSTYTQIQKTFPAFVFEANHTLSWHGTHKDISHSTHTSLTQDFTHQMHLERRTDTHTLLLFASPSTHTLLRYNDGPVQHTSDPSFQERWATVATSDIATASEWFLKNMRATQPTPKTLHGIHTLTYTLTFQDTPLDLPPHTPTSHPSPHSWLEHTRILDLSGSASVDTSSGIPVALTLQIRFETNDRPQNPSQGTLTYTHTLKPYTHKNPLEPIEGPPLQPAPAKAPALSFWNNKHPADKH